MNKSNLDLSVTLFNFCCARQAVLLLNVNSNSSYRAMVVHRQWVEVFLVYMILGLRAIITKQELQT